jgi:hypothetical protein
MCQIIEIPNSNAIAGVCYSAAKSTNAISINPYDGIHQVLLQLQSSSLCPLTKCEGVVVDNPAIELTKEALMPSLVVRAGDQSTFLPFILVFIGIPVSIAVTILLCKYGRYGGQSATNARRKHLALFTPWEWEGRRMLHWAWPWVRRSNGHRNSQGLYGPPAGWQDGPSPYDSGPTPGDSCRIGGGRHPHVLGGERHRCIPVEAPSDDGYPGSSHDEVDRGFCRRSRYGFSSGSPCPPLRRPKSGRGRRPQSGHRGYCRPQRPSKENRSCDGPHGGRGRRRPVPTPSSACRPPPDINRIGYALGGTYGAWRPENRREFHRGQNYPRGLGGRRRHSIGGFEFREPRSNFPPYSSHGGGGFDQALPRFPGGRRRGRMASIGDDDGYSAIPFPVHRGDWIWRFARGRRPNSLTSASRHDGTPSSLSDDFPPDNPVRVRGTRRNNSDGINLDVLDDMLQGHRLGGRERRGCRRPSSQPTPAVNADRMNGPDTYGRRTRRRGRMSGVGPPGLEFDGRWDEPQRARRARW